MFFSVSVGLSLERPFDRSQNLGPNCCNFFRGPFLHSPWVGAVWVNCVLIYVLNAALVCIGLIMAVKPGFTKALFDKLFKMFKPLKMKIFNGFNFSICLITKF